MNKKLCKECVVEYPATNEFFHLNKCVSHGLASWCKICVIKYNSNRKILKLEKLKEDLNDDFYYIPFKEKGIIRENLGNGVTRVVFLSNLRVKGEVRKNPSLNCFSTLF
jgi:hypothetical protein